jgi:hypothetical protein
MRVGSGNGDVFETSGIGVECPENKEDPKRRPAAPENPDE